MPQPADVTSWRQETLDFLVSVLSTFSEHYKGSILFLIVAGWVLIPVFTHRLTKNRERASLINKNIENIELIFEKMNELATEQFKLSTQDNTIFYNLIQCNQKLALYCNRMEKLDAKFLFPKEKILNIRQYTTNDKLIEKYGTHTMHRLVYEQIELIKLYPQQY